MELNRYFLYPKPQGCAGDWRELERRLEKIQEPAWGYIGQLWNKLYPGQLRPEEMQLMMADLGI